MKKLLSFFITNPIWGNAFVFLTIIFGLLSLFNMRQSFFPEIENRIITITVLYPGASPAEMEEGVTTKIEQALEGLVGVKKMTSSSSENMATIRIEGLSDADMDEMLTDVENTVNSINSFPAGAEKPIIKRQKVGEMGGMAAFVSLVGPDDLFGLKEKADQVKNDLLSVPSISQVNVIGYPEVEMSVEINEDKLLAYNLRFDQLVAAIRSSNVDMTGGSIKTDEEEFIIRYRGRTTKAKEIEDIVLRATPNGQLIILGDVAEVKYQFADRPIKSYLDGKRAVSVLVQKLPSEDLGQISDDLKSYVEKFNKQNKEYKLDIVFMFHDMLQERIDMLTSNGLMGMILVLICLGFFLSLRISFWVAFGIPISFLGLFAIGYLYGMTINMISLFGMIIVVGILVDDGIVISENIFSHYERGKSPMRAALDGTAEVFSSVISSVLTTVVAFALLMYVGGPFEMMREMAFAVVACLLFSLVEALLTLPQHLGKESMLKPYDIGWYNKVRKKINRFIDWMRDGYAGLMGGFLKRYRQTVFLPLVFVFIIVAFLFNGLIQATFFPNIQFDSINLEVAFKPGEREFQTEKYLEFCKTKVYKVRDELYQEFGDSIITQTTLTVGRADGLEETGAHSGNIRIELDLEGKDISSFEVIKRIRTEIGKIKGPEKFSIGGESRFGKKVAIMLTGDDLEQIKLAKEFVKEKMIGLGVLKDVIDNQPLGTQEIDFKLKPKAYMLQLTPMEISRQVRQGFFGDEAQKLIIGEDEVRVYARFPVPDRNSLGKFDDFRIKTINGETFPLSELIDYKIQRGDVSIRHFGTKKEITIEADPNNADAPVGELLARIEKEILKEMQSLYPGIEYQFMGEAERARESQGPMVIVLILTIILVTLILALNFNSLLQAIVVMTVIPAGVMSALLGHGLEGKPVSLFSAWGIIALIGILVNDAVVMLDTYNRYLRDGMSARDAAYAAGRARFRPILLTSLTTVVGLYPLIMEDSFQAQFLVPMAISVAHGLLWGTLFTMFFMPSMILFYNDVRRVWSWMWNGNTNPAIAFGLFMLMLVMHVLPIWLILYVIGQYKNTMYSIWRQYSIPSPESVEPTFRSLKMEEKLKKENWHEAIE